MFDMPYTPEITVQSVEIIAESHEINLPPPNTLSDYLLFRRESARAGFNLTFAQTGQFWISLESTCGHWDCSDIKHMFTINFNLD